MISSKVNRIAFAQVSDTLQSDQNKEPQFVRVRSTNRYRLFLDSKYNSSGNPCNALISTVQPGVSTGSYPNPLIDQTQRISTGGIQMTVNWQNVNIRNQNLKFEYDGVDYDTNIPAGLYTQPLDSRYVISNTPTFREDIISGELSYKQGLLSAIVNAMNTRLSFPKWYPNDPNTAATGNPIPSEFHVSVLSDRGNYTISTFSGKTFRMLPCDAITYGQDLYALNVNAVAATNQGFGSANYLHTRYFDVSSSALKSYSKHQSTGSGVSPDLLARIYMTKEFLNNKFSLFILDKDLYDNFDIGAELRLIDIRFTDEFGQELYIPDKPGLPGVKDLTFNIQIVGEV